MKICLPALLTEIRLSTGHLGCVEPDGTQIIKDWKTALTKVAGTYTFGDFRLNKKLLAATGKRRDALRHLAQSSGSVCILDDVKAERVRERKNSMRNIIDDLIRSTFRDRLMDTVGMDSESN